GDTLDLPPFPTRRSSDLLADWAGPLERGNARAAQVARCGRALEEDVARAERHGQLDLLGCAAAAWPAERRRAPRGVERIGPVVRDRKSTRLNSSHVAISY